MCFVNVLDIFNTINKFRSKSHNVYYSTLPAISLVQASPAYQTTSMTETMLAPAHRPRMPPMLDRKADLVYI